MRLVTRAALGAVLEPAAADHTDFLQDPQSNLFSPVVPLTLLVGPTIALRLVTAAWGALGVYLFTSWMRRRVSVQAALLGGLASVSSLGVLWRVAAGNDMFLWHLGLPGLLWSCEKLMREERRQRCFGSVSHWGSCFLAQPMARSSSSSCR